MTARLKVDINYMLSTLYIPHCLVRAVEIDKNNPNVMILHVEGAGIADDVKDVMVHNQITSKFVRYEDWDQ